MSTSNNTSNELSIGEAVSEYNNRHLFYYYYSVVACWRLYYHTNILYSASIQYHTQSNDIDANIAMILNLPEVVSAFARKNDQEGTDIDALKEELTNKMKDKFQADASSGIPIQLLQQYC